MKESMDRFPARLPPALKKALAEKAEKLPGTSMNDLVVLGVRHVVEGADLIVTTSGVVDAYEDLVLAAIEGEIGPAKGIAGHYVETGQPNLGALLYWFASEMQSEPKEKAKELVLSADKIQKRARPIAKALLRAALEHNPGSDVAKSRLGQLLYYDHDYAGAAELLEPVRNDDNYAKLAFGWSKLALATNAADVTRARDEVVVALRRWALGQRSPAKRESWINQVAELKARGPEFEQAVENLVAYAHDNASWEPIVMSEIKLPARTRTSEAEFEELSGEGRADA